MWKNSWLRYKRRGGRTAATFKDSSTHKRLFLMPFSSAALKPQGVRIKQTNIGLFWLQGTPVRRQGLDWKYMMWQSSIILCLKETCRKSGKWEILDSQIQIANIQMSENKEQGFKVYIT